MTREHSINHIFAFSLKFCLTHIPPSAWFHISMWPIQTFTLMEQSFEIFPHLVICYVGKKQNKKQVKLHMKNLISKIFSQLAIASLLTRRAMSATTWQDSASKSKLGICIFAYIDYCIFAYIDYCIFAYVDYCIFAYVDYCIFAYIDYCIFAYIDYCIFEYIDYCIFAYIDYCILQYTYYCILAL